MQAISQQKLIVMPRRDPEEAARTQDFYRKIVDEYRAKQRRRVVFRQIGWTIYFAIITSSALIYVLRACGLY